MRKARQATTAALDEIAPNQLHHLWKSIVSKPLEPQNSSEEDDDVDNVLMEALSECYANANRWDTKRQILSIMADKVSYGTLLKWIPNLSRYRFTVAGECKRHDVGERANGPTQINKTLPQE